MVVFCWLTYYSAVLMSQTREMLQRYTGVSPGSMGQAAKLLFGERAGQITFVLVYGLFAFLGNASYLLVLGGSLSDIIEHYGGSRCSMTASLWACLLVLPCSVSIRRLR